MNEKDESLLWSHLIFTGTVVNPNKRLQIEITADNGPKIVCPITPVEQSGPLELHEQSRLLAFRLSSTLEIEVIRKSRMPGIKHTEGKCVGSVADYIKQDKTITLIGETNGTITVTISLSNDYAKTIMKGVDASLGALDTNPMLGRTSDAVDKVTHVGTNLYDTANTLSDVFTPLGQALQLLVKIGDNLADAHPILKASWVVLSTVYKVVQKQKTQDDAVRDLADTLREMLGAANACPDLREIESTTRVSESIGLAALDIASLIEECTKYVHLSARVAQSQFKDLESRIAQCKQQCNALLVKFDRRVHIGNHVDLKDIKRTLNVELEMKEKENIFKWLDAPDPSGSYNSAREKHCRGTGEWFLMRAEYEKWKREPDLPLFLWGTPGFGKTILCSTVIRDIMAHCKSTGSKSAYAYFMFDGRNLRADFQQHRKSIRSLIQQLAQQYQSFPLPLKTLYGNGTHQPSIEDLEDTFVEMISAFNDVYIIIDSLDECNNQEWSLLCEWIRSVTQQQTGRIHLFATSRPEYDIQEDLRIVKHVNFTLKEDLVYEDLGLFIQQQVKSDRRLNKLTADTDVGAAVTSNAFGMFRLVALRLEQLKGCLSDADIEERLADLPKDLDEVYQRMIDKLDLSYRRRVLLILQWLAFSMRSVTLREIAEVVTIDFPERIDTGGDDVPRFNPKRRFKDKADVLSICGGLVDVSPLGDIMLSHLTVKEYLLSPRREEGSPSFHCSPSLAHSAIAQTCIAYLLQFSDGSHRIVPEDRFDFQFVANFPLADYAGHYWYLHLRSAEKDIDLEDKMLHQLTMKLLLSDPALQATTTIYDPHNDYGHYKHYPDASPLYYSIVMGLRRATKELLDRAMEPNRKDEDLLGDALMAASFRGDMEMINMLVEKGVDPKLRGGVFGSPLCAAVTSGHLDATKFFLEQGADPNFCPPNGGQFTLLHMSALSRRAEIVKVLLDHGADINAKDDRNGNALQDTCALGYADMVRLLLENGADPNYGGEGRALQAAAYSGDTSVVNLLLAHGADPNLPGGYRDLGTAMHAAAASGHQPVIEILIKAGGNINSNGGMYGGVIQAAIVNDDEELVRFLLDNGADPNFTGGDKYEHPLVTASEGNNPGIVKLLVQKGVNPNLPETKYVLQRACDSGNSELVKVLLKHGADPNVLGGRRGSSLQAAIFEGFPEIVELLLEHGAEPKIYGRDGKVLLPNVSEKDLKAMTGDDLEEIWIHQEDSLDEGTIAPS